MTLLSHDEFRESVFARDHHRCVVCGAPAQDAHHLIERRLWPDGGYYLTNGASLCAEDHWLAETTAHSVEDLRAAAGITEVAVPPGFYRDSPITKWGDDILPDGTRVPGPLFWDESVQKILHEGGVLDLYRTWRKHPRTGHLPWSEGVNKDDVILTDTTGFENREVVVTVKMDGQNITLYQDGLHGRSLTSASHPSQAWVKGLHARIAHLIPEGTRVCGENLYAQHSIAYNHLPAYFVVHSIWDGDCSLSWDETTEWCALLELSPVPVLYRGLWNERAIRALYTPTFADDPMEGYVVRLTDRFSYAEYRSSVAKFVRAGHNVTSHGWRHRSVVPNRLASDMRERTAIW